MTIDGAGYSAYTTYGNYGMPSAYAARGNYGTPSAYNETGSGVRDSLGIFLQDSSSPQGVDPTREKEHSADPDAHKKPGRRSAPEDCETCKNRKYQDGSDENNVSFKNASHISPDAAGAAVRAHEGQHVKNAYNKAEEAGGKVLAANVSIHTATCPECGRIYVSGGTTKTTIKYTDESNPYQQNRKLQDGLSLRGANLNLYA